MLDEEGVEVAAVIDGYISKVIFDKSKCEVCKTLLTTVKSDSSKLKYLNKLSRGVLLIPSIDLLHYVSKSFAIIDCVSDLIKKSSRNLQNICLAKEIITQVRFYVDIISTCCERLTE